ncbi:flagellar hook assembly protein FlgD [Aureimonas mangrovi]|uniref:flagellar hook assembly protein FlgD n=1 Tax=Aureimonas mangrovi TaxID=2758041 RepID=UPI00163DE228|nr:flagellar hook assembly protein FlgD [Aureimonas mangrovi]
MSNIAPLSNAGATSSAATNATSSQLQTGMDYNAFLQLLIAQIRNQDPLAPMDPTEQMSQLASFSNVEQTIRLNQRFDTMITVSSLTQADNLIGRQLTSADGSVSGVVKSVSVAKGEVQATLTNGTVVPLIDGVKIE